jgi:hypothetical protein
MKKNKAKYIGKWRIIEMEMWDQNYIDLIIPGYFSFDKEDLGYFQFGVVEGQLDYRVEKIGDVERLEFSWEGQSENDPALGRGRAVINGDCLEGRIYLHLSDDSWFKAKKIRDDK